MKVVFVVFKGKAHGQGGITRGLAFRNALDRAGYLAPNGPVEMWLAGTPDSLHLWPDQDKVIQYNSYTAGPQDQAEIERFCNELGQEQFDIMLVDNQTRPLLPLICPTKKTPIQEDPDWQAKGLSSNIIGYDYEYRDDRPRQVWNIARYHPRAWGGTMSRTGFPMQAIDRQYLIEPHKLYAEGWIDDYPINLPRSVAMRASQARGELGPVGYHSPPYRPGDPESDHNSMPEYLAKHRRLGWKLLSPVVNVDLSHVLSRDEARTQLCQKFNLDPERPIALMLGRSQNMSENDQTRFASMQEELAGQPDQPQVVVLGGGSGYGEYLPQAWRYYAGCDYVVVAAGYNAYWEVRYLQKKGLFTGKFGVVYHEDFNEDQAWRYKNHVRGALNWEHYWNYVDHHEASTFENGADEIAYLIARNGNLLNS